MELNLYTPVKDKDIQNGFYTEKEPTGEMTIHLTFYRGEAILDTQEFKDFESSLKKMLDKAKSLQSNKQ